MRRTKEDSEQTRQDILDAAVKIFSDKGIARTTIADIAKEAGVTRGAIYWHFKNKTEIFLALHQALHEPFVAMITKDVENDHPDPLLQLHDLCLTLLLDIKNNEAKRRILTLFMLKAPYDGELAIYKEDHRNQKKIALKMFDRYFERAIKSGKLSTKASPEICSNAVYCFIKGIIFEYLDNPNDFDLEKSAPSMIDLFFSIIEKQ